MDPINVRAFLPFVIYFSSVPLGLWAARGLVSPLTRSILPNETQLAPLRRPLQLTLWLALGGLFAAPLVDLLAALESALSLIFGSGELFPTGLTPQPYYTLLMLLILAVVYGFVLWVGRHVFQSLQVQDRLPRMLSGLEQFFLLLAPASLVYRLLRGLIQNILLLPGYDTGVLNSLSQSGYLLLALGALVAVAGLVGILLLSLRGEELRQDIDRL